MRVRTHTLQRKTWQAAKQQQPTLTFKLFFFRNPPVSYKLSSQTSLFPTYSFKIWHALLVSVHMLVLRRCLSLDPSHPTLYTPIRGSHTHTEREQRSTRHNVAVLLPLQPGRYELKNSVILSATCCGADEPVCWLWPTKGNFSLMLDTAVKAPLTGPLFPQCLRTAGQMLKNNRHHLAYKCTVGFKLEDDANE